MEKKSREGEIAAILCGENILLAGPKATGKSMFAENLAGPSTTVGMCGFM